MIQSTRRSQPADLQSTIRAIRGWLASDMPRSPSGAYYSWLDSTTGAPGFEYPEITGYALTHLAGQAAASDAEVDAGKAAGAWLLARLHEGDLSAHEDYDSGAAYNFDLAMISTGLMAFGSGHDEPSFVDAGLRLAIEIRDQVANQGRLESIVAGSDVTTSRSAWSTEGFAHLLKADQCLLWAHKLGETGCDSAARTLVAQCVKSQQPDGRFVTHPSDSETMLHPHLYAVEGLFMLGSALNDQQALHRARLGAEWVWPYQLPSGGFPRYVSNPDQVSGPEQFDLTGQALRAALFTGIMPSQVESVVDRLCEGAVPVGPYLAMPYQPDSRSTHANVWASLFAVQALQLAESQAPALDWRYLV